MVVDSVHLPVPGVGPVGKSTLRDPSKDGVELIFGDEESVVMTLSVSAVVVVEADPIGSLEAHEGAERLRWIKAEDLRKKIGGRFLVLDRDDGVVELNCHGASLQLDATTIISPTRMGAPDAIDAPAVRADGTLRHVGQ
jgi:hypothetical protein